MEIHVALDGRHAVQGLIAARPWSAEGAHHGEARRAGGGESPVFTPFVRCVAEITGGVRADGVGLVAASAGGCRHGRPGAVCRISRQGRRARA
ncbi:hypothetical protein PYK79_12865 [Streptomyces sp. ID05-04B]|uniref:hypothetical protein n=1 Tax=unclassified Streptomyces TaxID=2593676 RepID=UPI00131EDF3B|nr:MULTISPECIES: hypothetical protein [unclassified Streptomyces]MDX5564085.1 hypothetical protein [Streptomyces sp. ID05-04B]